MQFRSKLVLCITGSTLCVNKSKVISSFRGIWYGLYFLVPFFFSLSLPISKGSTLAKIWDAEVAPAGFYRPDEEAQTNVFAKHECASKLTCKKTRYVSVRCLSFFKKKQISVSQTNKNLAKSSFW